MTAFRRLSGTTWSSDFSRPFVISFLFLDDYRRALLCSRRPRDLPGKERRTSVSLPSPLRAINQRISGFNAVGHLTLIARLTALRFRSVQHGTLDFHRTPLFRGFLSPRSMPLSLRCRVPSVWAPRGLTFSFQVHLLFCAHAGRTHIRAPSAPASVTDNVTVTAPHDPRAANNTRSSTTSVISAPTADLSVSMQASKTSAVVSSTVRF